MIRATVFAAALLLAGCAGTAPAVLTPDTPQQALVGLRTAEVLALTSFRAYAAQRPFCRDPGARTPPLCAERSVVIEGAAVAVEVHQALATADKIVAAAGASDVGWAALAEPKKLLARLRDFVLRARGDAP